MTNIAVYQCPDGTWWFRDKKNYMKHGPYGTKTDALTAWLRHGSTL